MKKTALLIILMFSFVSAAQTDPVKDADNLISKRKYLSAFTLLQEADPKNENPDIVVLKSEIVLNYFVKSMMHEMFALKDLLPGEDLMELRRGDGSFEMFMYNPSEHLNKLIKKYPKNYKLYYALGYYYNEVYGKYSDNWKISPQEIINLFEKNYKIAYDHGVYDYWSLYGIGYAKMLNKKYNDAIPYLEKSISLNDKDATCQYNLAYAYLFTGQASKGIDNAVTAYNLYEYKPYKADAARVAAYMYNEIKDHKKAKEYLIYSDKAEPKNYYTYKELLRTEFYLKSNGHDKWAKEIFKISLENPDIYADVIEIYSDFDKSDEILDLLTKYTKNKRNADIEMASLYFYIAMLYYQNDDFANSEKSFDKAELYFKKVYKEDHYVFGVIKEAREKMKRNEI